jgi:hypothetical protein
MRAEMTPGGNPVAKQAVFSFCRAAMLAELFLNVDRFDVDELMDNRHNKTSVCALL